MLVEKSAFYDLWKNRIHCKDRAYEKYGPGLYVKHQIAHFVSPKVIVEIGVRAGYSAWAMLLAEPSATFIGFDDFREGWDGIVGPVGFGKEVKAHALKLLGSWKPKILEQDVSRKGFVVPTADLYHVDGDHSFESEKRDILTCVRAMASSSVIAVHDFLCPPVRRAIEEVVKESGLAYWEIPERRNGDAILYSKQFPPLWMSTLDSVDVR